MAAPNNSSTTLNRPPAPLPTAAKRTRRKAEVPADETKAQKWKRLVNARGYKAIKAIRALSTLANTANYEYTDEQVNALINKLTQEIVSVKNRYTAKVQQDEPTGIV